MKRGVCNIFPVKSFVLTVPKIFVKESYCFWESFWFLKVFTDEKWGSCHIFLLQINGLTVPKNFVSIPAIFQKNCVIEKIYAKKGLSRFLSKISGMTVPKKVVGIPSRFHKVWGNRNLVRKIEGITFFRQKLSVSQCGIFLYRNSTVFERHSRFKTI